MAELHTHTQVFHPPPSSGSLPPMTRSGPAKPESKSFFPVSHVGSGVYTFKTIAEKLDQQPELKSATIWDAHTVGGGLTYLV